MHQAAQRDIIKSGFEPYGGPHDFIYVLLKFLINSLCAKDCCVCVFNQSLPAVDTK